MIAESGHAALWLAAAFALLGALGRKLGEAREFAVTAVSLGALLALCALLALIWSAEAADFSLILVDDRIHRLQQPLVRLAAMLQSPGGWLLTAATSVGAAAVIAALLGRHAGRYAFALFPLLAATLAADPFQRQPVIAPEGRALWLPIDLGAALAGPLLLALAVAVLVSALVTGGWQRPPRWMAIAGTIGLVLSVAAGGLAQMLTTTASGRLVSGQTLRLQGFDARLIELRPVAWPGFTAIEARLAVGRGGEAD